MTVQESLVETYVAHLVNSLGGPVSLEGIKVVVDCANGAAYQAAPAAFEAQGAEVHRIHAEPDGININENCGSTHMDSLRSAVLEQRADLGIALDGDADRCLAVDAFGRIVDGDQILAILALTLREEGRLKNDTIVATVMSNLGLVNAMRDAGVTVEQTKVGDRYVLEAMKAGDFVLGGEQSGHVVMSEHAKTGDGTLTSLHLMSRMATSGQSLAQLASVMTRLPQVLINVPDVDKSRAASDPAAHGCSRRGPGRARGFGPGSVTPLRYRVAGPRHGRGRELRGSERNRASPRRRGQDLIGPLI